MPAGCLTRPSRTQVSPRFLHPIPQVMKSTAFLFPLFGILAAASLSAQEKAPSKPNPSPTYANVRYGPHERNILDFWQAKSDRPTPVVVSIHGGGFRRLNKSVRNEILDVCLANGISVAAISYRYSTQAIAPAPFLDSARAVQFLRSRAKEWHIAKEHFGGTGGSAGAGMVLWLGFHDDLADPDNADPVLRESSRLSCMAVINSQTSYDPRFIKALFPPNAPLPAEDALADLFGMKTMNDFESAPPEKVRLFEEVSPIHHLTRDDGPVLMIYPLRMDAPPDIHHPLFGMRLKEKMDALKIPCEVMPGTAHFDQAQVLAFFRQYLKP